LGFWLLRCLGIEDEESTIVILSWKTMFFNIVFVHLWTNSLRDKKWQITSVHLWTNSLVDKKWQITSAMERRVAGVVNDMMQTQVPLLPYSIFGVHNHAPLFYLSRIECHPPMRRGCKLTLLYISNKTLLKKSHSSQKQNQKAPAYYYHVNGKQTCNFDECFLSQQKKCPKSVGHLIQTCNWTKR
jgi:hypothetical protein